MGVSDCGSARHGRLKVSCPFFPPSLVLGDVIGSGVNFFEVKIFIMYHSLVLLTGLLGIFIQSAIICFKEMSICRDMASTIREGFVLPLQKSQVVHFYHL